LEGQSCCFFIIFQNKSLKNEFHKRKKVTIGMIF